MLKNKIKEKLPKFIIDAIKEYRDRPIINYFDTSYQKKRFNILYCKPF